MCRIGLIGYGYWGPVLANCFRNAQHPFCTIVDRHPDQYQKIRNACGDVNIVSSIDEILADSTIEGLVIALPTSMHYEVCRKALLAGKHVLLEKPMTSSAAHAEELNTLADELGLTLMVDHHFVYKKSVRRIKSLVDSQTFGTLDYYESTRANWGIFRKDDDVVWDLLPHDLSILKYVIGRDPISVSAVGSCHVEPGKTDMAHVNLFYEDNFAAHVFVSWLAPEKLRTVYIGGAQGVALFDDNEPIYKLKTCGISHRYFENTGVLLEKGSWQAEEDTVNALACVAEEFVRCIQTGERPLSDGRFALDIINTIEAVQKSIGLNGQPVSVINNGYKKGGVL